MRPACKCGDFGVGDISLSSAVYGEQAGMGDISLTWKGPGMAGLGGGSGLAGWTDVLQQGATTGFEIVKGIFDPRYKPGTSYAETQQGTFIQRSPSLPGFQIGTTAFPGTVGGEMGGDAWKWLAFGLVGFALISAIGKR